MKAMRTKAVIYWLKGKGESAIAAEMERVCTKTYMSVEEVDAILYLKLGSKKGPKLFKELECDIPTELNVQQYPYSLVGLKLHSTEQLPTMTARVGSVTFTWEIIKEQGEFLTLKCIKCSDNYNKGLVGRTESWRMSFIYNEMVRPWNAGHFILALAQVDDEQRFYNWFYSYADKVRQVDNVAV